MRDFTGGSKLCKMLNNASNSFYRKNVNKKTLFNQIVLKKKNDASVIGKGLSGTSPFNSNQFEVKGTNFCSPRLDCFDKNG